MSPELYTWLSTALSTIFALCAWVLSLIAMRRTGLTLPARTKMRITELEAEVERLGQWYKKLNSSYALIIARQKKAGDDQNPPEFIDTGNLVAQRNGESADEWKRRIRKANAAGKIHLQHS